MIYLVCASEAHSAVCVWFRCGPQGDNEGVVMQIVDNGTVTDHSWVWLVVGCLWEEIFLGEAGGRSFGRR